MYSNVYTHHSNTYTYCKHMFLYIVICQKKCTFGYENWYIHVWYLCIQIYIHINQKKCIWGWGGSAKRDVVYVFKYIWIFFKYFYILKTYVSVYSSIQKTNVPWDEEGSQRETWLMYSNTYTYYSNIFTYQEHMFLYIVTYKKKKKYVGMRREHKERFMHICMILMYSNVYTYYKRVFLY